MAATAAQDEQQQRDTGSTGEESHAQPENRFVIGPREIRPPPFPARPDLFDEVEWGPFPTKDDVEKAYLLWSVPDRTLTLSPEEMVDPPPQDATWTKHAPMYCLVENVYQNLLQQALLPITEEQYNSRAQYRYDPETGTRKGWTYRDLFGRDPTPEPVEQPQPDPTNASKPTILINGRNILKDKFWVKTRLQAELRRRELDENGLVDVLRQRLYDDELHKLTKPAPPEPTKDKNSLLPREDMSQWGIPRRENYMLKISADQELSPLDLYTWAIILSPYNPAYWTSRAFLHYQMGYFDLAIGDAYRAQLLCDVLVNPQKRNAQPGLYIRIWDALERHVLQIPRRDGDGKISAEVSLMRMANGVNYFTPAVRKAIHHIISLSLLAMQCWEDYFVTEPQLKTRLVMPDRDAIAIQARQDGLKDFVASALQLKHNKGDEFYFERRYGCAQGRPYPYGPQTNQRSKQEFVDKINQDILPMSPATTESQSRKIEVRLDVENDDLGVYAAEDIPQGEVVYVDEPSIRGHLQVKRRLREDTYFCENCKRILTPGQHEHQQQSMVPANVDICECSKLVNEKVYWCAPPGQTDQGESGNETQHRSRGARGRGARKRTRTQAPDDEDNGHSDSVESSSKRQKSGHDSNGGGARASCKDIAKSLYHHRICGKNWSWLHDAMRPVLAKADPGTGAGPQLTHTNEDHGTILSLLLREVFDITLRRRETEGKPNLFAHEIDELMPLMGAEDQSGNNFPFSFAANIRVPFDILSCLGVNIFRDLTFDTWVIQLVLRKLVINAIPWDYSRRSADSVDDANSKRFKQSNLRGLLDLEFPFVDPTFRDLYIFPGVAMFNHSCHPHHNISCDWDRAIPNRLILWANRSIKKNEQLFIQYSNWPFNSDRSYRILGDLCYCRSCQSRPDSPPPPVPDIYGGDTSPDSFDEEDDYQHSGEEPLSGYEDAGIGSSTTAAAVHHAGAGPLPVASDNPSEEVEPGQAPIADPTPVTAPAPEETKSEAETEIEIKSEEGPAAAATTATTPQPQPQAQTPAQAQPPAPAPRRGGTRVRYRGRIMSVQEFRQIAQQRSQDSASGSTSHGSEQSQKENIEEPA